MLVTLDALGTLVALAPPAPLLAAQLRARGIACDERQAGLAMRAEIAYYRAHNLAAGDAAALDDLRERCSAVLRDALAGAGVTVGAVALAELRAALLAALRFEPFAEVPDALRALRAAGHSLVVVSNWDVSLHDMLRTTGLRELVDGAVSSAEVGAAKPAPAAFERAFAIAGVERDGPHVRGLHAGDSLAEDVGGAIAARLRPVLVARDGVPAGLPAGVAVVRSLTELAALAA